jgi:hypothetical protein
VRIERNVINVNRTVGAMLSGEVARRYGHAGLPDNTINIAFKGVAGSPSARSLLMVSRWTSSAMPTTMSARAFRAAA